MKELIVIDESSAMEVLSGDISHLFTQIEEKVCVTGGDISVKAVRDEIKSNAFQVTKTKTAIAKMIDELIKQKKAEIEPITNQIDNLKSNKKKSNARLADLAAATKGKVTDYEQELAEAEMRKLEQQELEEMQRKRDTDHELALAMNENINKDIAAEKEKRDREEVERIEKIKTEAAEKAKEQAEAKEKENREQLERDRLQSIMAKEEAERQLEQQKKNEARLQQEAADKAKADEIARQHREEREKREAEEKREADRQHASNVMRQSKEAMMELGITEAQARSIVIAIKNGTIPNITLKF